ncbi:hypothetical protein FRB94_004924 [Tulasnella sp. JGI-2019a]|nr:hypothetical protein FRB93_005577 [Tulasnella sp. JGI-2019a]KAG9001126.1 hypothetical protein FRB94_004924 [Tulasnella sp. JGI-2019a]KAG9025746.1 hypothetical protein FRB95_009813 [Tulasnella sp. JGI-2019a]
MATPTSHKKNSSAVKRIMSEARELRDDDSTEYTAGPLEQDIFEWHCTIRGPADTEFEGGLYHCRIQLPAEYPFKAPSIMVLTPNGRFELNKPICISFTSYHEELWQPAWGVRTAIIGLQGFFPLKGENAVGVGAVEYPIAERKRLAALSRCWTCPDCGQSNLELLPDPPANATSSSIPSSVSSLENPVAPSHPSIAQASIPGKLPAILDAATKGGATSNVLGELLPPTDFIDPVPDVASIPIVPVTTAPLRAPTPPQLHQELDQMAIRPGAMAPVTDSVPTDEIDEEDEEGMRTPRASERALPPTVVLNHPALQTQQPAQHVATANNGARPRPPIWLDGAIAFFAFLIAYVAGRRVSYVWEFVTDHI